MLLFAQQTTPRLQHMAHWLGIYLFGQPLSIATVAQKIAAGEAVINYTDQPLPFTSFHLQPHPLLFQHTIQAQDLAIKWADEQPYFFETSGDFPFDVLAASFYLLQRYEEYLPHQKDHYGRYAHSNSLAFQNDFLHLPVVDIWMGHLKTALQQRFPQLQFSKRRFHYLPTYDVDIAYAYRGKGLLRNLGGLYRNLASGQLDEVMNQANFVLSGTPDPFDVFDELNSLHQENQLYPIYFLLLAQRQSGVDKNISPYKNAYRQLIQRLAAQYRTGIHFSGAAALSPGKMKAEKAILEKVTSYTVTANRMHYLLLHLPKTYWQLVQLGITEDYTMGYGTANGFRASTCTPYYWYNLISEKSTLLQIFPFCYMDAVSLFEEETTPAGALQEMKRLLQTVQQVQGHFISIFHNHFMGLNAGGRQQMELYREFLKVVTVSAE